MRARSPSRIATQTRATQQGRLFCVRGRSINVEAKGDAQLEQALDRIEAPPERVRPSASRWKYTLAISVCFSLRFSRAAYEVRAPKLLHVGRRPLCTCATSGR